MHEGWYPNSGSPYAGAHGSYKNSADIVEDITGTRPEVVLDPTWLWDFTTDENIVKPQYEDYLSIIDVNRYLFVDIFQWQAHLKVRLNDCLKTRACHKVLLNQTQFFTFNC